MKIRIFLCGSLIGFLGAFLIPAEAQVSFALAVNARDELEALEKYLGVECDTRHCTKVRNQKKK